MDPGAAPRSVAVRALSRFRVGCRGQHQTQPTCEKQCVQHDQELGRDQVRVKVNPLFTWLP